MADSISIAKILGEFGKAVSPQGSPGGALGAASSSMASDEAERRFLTNAMGGGTIDLKGKYGLSPDFVLKSLRARSALEQAESQKKSRAIADKAGKVGVAQGLMNLESSKEALRNRVPVEISGKTVSLSPTEAARVNMERRKFARQLEEDRKKYQRQQAEDRKEATSRSLQNKLARLGIKEKEESLENRVVVPFDGQEVSMDPVKAASVIAQKDALEYQVQKDFPTFQDWQNLSEEGKAEYREFIQGQSKKVGIDPNEILAKYFYESQAEAQVDIGTVSDLSERAKTFDDTEVNRFMTENDLSSSAEARRVLALQSAATELKQRVPDYVRTNIRRNPNNPNEYAIVGETKDGQTNVVKVVDLRNFGTD